jgi:hypothetical protein
VLEPALVLASLLVALCQAVEGLQDETTEPLAIEQCPLLKGWAVSDGEALKEIPAV